MVRSLGHIEGRVWMCLWRALGRAARRTAAHKVMVLYSPGIPHQISLQLHATARDLRCFSVDTGTSQHRMARHDQSRDPWLLRNPCASIARLVPDARDPHSWTFDPLIVVAIGVWGTVPHSTIAALTALGLSVTAANAALGAALESIAHDNMLISRLRHSSPTRWRGA